MFFNTLIAIISISLTSGPLRRENVCTNDTLFYHESGLLINSLVFYPGTYKALYMQCMQQNRAGIIHNVRSANDPSAIGSGILNAILISAPQSSSSHLLRTSSSAAFANRDQGTQPTSSSTLPPLLLRSDVQ